MSARHAVLGLVIQKPDYPYKLAVRFTDHIGPAWQVNVGQVYQTVERLEREGLIRVTGSNPSTRGERCTYEATDEGIEEFERWICDANEAVRPQRNMLLLKLAMSGPEHSESLLNAIDRQEQICMNSLRDYSAARRSTTNGSEPGWKTVMYQLILESSIRQVEAEINWLRQVRSEVRLRSSV